MYYLLCILNSNKHIIYMYISKIDVKSMILIPGILYGQNFFVPGCSCVWNFLGGFAKVKLAYHALTGEKVAIKIMDKRSLGVSVVTKYGNL